MTTVVAPAIRRLVPTTIWASLYAMFAFAGAFASVYTVYNVTPRGDLLWIIGVPVFAELVTQRIPRMYWIIACVQWLVALTAGWLMSQFWRSRQGGTEAREPGC